MFSTSSKMPFGEGNQLLSLLSQNNLNKFYGIRSRKHQRHAKSMPIHGHNLHVFLSSIVTKKMIRP